MVLLLCYFYFPGTLSVFSMLFFVKMHLALVLGADTLLSAVIIVFKKFSPVPCVFVFLIFFSVITPSFFVRSFLQMFHQLSLLPSEWAVTA